MLMGELVTLVKYDLNVKIDRHQEQLARPDQMGADGVPRQSRNSAATWSRSTSSRVAEGCGLRGVHIEDPARCGEQLRDALATPGPALIEAMVDPNEPPMPPKVEAKQALHLAEVARQRHAEPRQDRADHRLGRGARAGLMPAPARRGGASRLPGRSRARARGRSEGERCQAASTSARGGRALYATDASNYRQVPIGIVTPRDRDEVIETVRFAASTRRRSWRAAAAPALPARAATSRWRSTSRATCTE